MNLNGFINGQPKIKQFHHPFAYILYNFQSEHYCSYCLRSPLSIKDKLLLCTGCRHHRYCDKECQRRAWIGDHKKECSRLKASFPNLPMTDVLFLARIIDKLNFMKEKGDVHNWQRERKFEDLMTHENETRQDKEKMARFEKIYEKTKQFFSTENGLMPGKEEFYLIFCRTWINSHSIHASVGTEIGMALDLGISRYDHNCRPNATLVFDGYRAAMRPLEPNLDAADYTKTYISYVDVGRSKCQRRRQLQSQWYFLCQCQRCQDPDDDELTSIRCSNASCTEPLVITEETEATDLACQHCSTVTKRETILKAQGLMNSVPSKLSITAISDADLDKFRLMLEKTTEILHPKNVYLTRLVAAYTEMTSGQDEEKSSIETLITIYQNYKRYYPTHDRHIGYHLLHLIKALIERGRRTEATSYAHEAMNVFEVCFGIEHPYYLKTLALWTFLDQSVEKRKEELLELMNFNYNRPIDLAALMEAI